MMNTALHLKELVAFERPSYTYLLRTASTLERGQPHGMEAYEQFNGKIARDERMCRRQLGSRNSQRTPTTCARQR